MSSTNNQTAKIKDHYRNLAPQYKAQANQVCEEAYLQLVKHFLRDRHAIMELGSGCSDLLDKVGGAFAVACDLSIEMLQMRSGSSRAYCVATVGERLPFQDSQFDGIFLINLLEHVTDLELVLSECARVLREGGIWLAVTPNGNWEFWLDLAERLSLKIPEGPHSFLKRQQLFVSAQRRFEVIEHKTFLVAPVQSARFARFIDRVSFCERLGWGFFQYIVARKPRPTLND